MAKDSRGGKRGTTIERFEYKRSSDIKEWSEAEQKRSKDISSKIYGLVYGTDTEGFYEETFIEDIFEETIKADGYQDEDVTVSKMVVTYADYWDENDNRVKKGKAVTGTTYYVVNGDDGAVDENTFAYKTKADALHMAQLYIDEQKQFKAYMHKKTR